MANEFLNQQSQLLDALGDDQLRSIASLFLSGLSNDAIIEQLEISRSAFYRKMTSIKKRWQSFAPAI